jgi:hypothetical protein
MTTIQNDNNKTSYFEGIVSLVVQTSPPLRARLVAAHMIHRRLAHLRFPLTHLH